MNGLTWWMRIVGVFYVLLGIQNLPFLIRGRLPTQYPGFEAPLDSIATMALVDTRDLPRPVPGSPGLRGGVVLPRLRGRARGDHRDGALLPAAGAAGGRIGKAAARGHTEPILNRTSAPLTQQPPESDAGPRGSRD